MTKRGAYYNENEPYAAQWLRNLIAAGHIAPGDVDERSICDVHPDDFKGYAQRHWFAGIGVWSYALRAEGWEDDREVETGSCPCQGFSVAGKRKGVEDERHLWPEWFRLLRDRSEKPPGVILGEQVSSPDGLAWFDIVSSDLESAGYTTGAIDSCAASVGAPHIRQRLYWSAVGVGHADANHTGLEGRRKPGRQRSAKRAARASGLVGGLEHAESDGRIERRTEPGERGALAGRGARGLADSEGNGSASRAERPGQESVILDTRRVREPSDLVRPGSSPTNGFWGTADWLYCRDDKWRPVEPGTFPLADGVAARVGRLRAYGNALVAPQARAFIRLIRDIVG